MRFRSIITNAAAAEIYGFELEVALRPTDTWSIDGSLGWIDAEFTEVDPTATEVTVDSEFERVPEWTASIGVSKDIITSDYGIFTPRVDWSYRSDFFLDALNTPIIQQDSYSVVNASVAWDTQYEGFRFNVGVDNIFDEDYMATGIFGVAQGFAEAIFDR